MSENEWVVHGVQVRAVTSLEDSRYEAVVAVTSPESAPPAALRDALAEARALDAAVEREPAVLRCARAAGQRLVLAPTGPLTPYDDVRSLAEAAARGVRRAAAAGVTQAIIALPIVQRWPYSRLVTLLGAIEALYIPLQIRESFPSDAPARVTSLGVFVDEAAGLESVIKDAVALEISRGVARDIGGADPERMTPLAAAGFLRDVFAGAAHVRVRVLEDAAAIRREYPLFAAVSRAADAVPRHRGCIVYLEYVPPEYDETVMLVGKGVTYDTGGADIKTGGAMAGMSRDKCGAAAVAGFIKACELLRPRLKAVAALAMVRNSVGEEAYVADELLRSRGGLAVRVGNTDAEGRLAMADLLDEMRERAAAERAPHLYTVATLTGHAQRAYGPYTAVLDNHAAHAAGHARALAAAAEALGEPAEVSRLRREDVAAHAGRAPGERLHQAESRPSTQLARGHQGPAAFLAGAARLTAGDTRYTHLDVAGSAGAPPAPPTAAPLLALAAHHKLIAAPRV